MNEPQGSTVPGDLGNPTAGSANVVSAGYDDDRTSSGLADGLHFEENRAKAQAKGWKTVDDVVTSYSNLESRLGRRAVQSDEDGWSEDTEPSGEGIDQSDHSPEFEFDLPDGLPDNFVYSEALVDGFRDWAKESNLDSGQAQKLHDHFVRYQAGQYAQYAEDRDQAVESAHQNLVKVWGPPESESYARNREFAQRAIRNLGGEKLVHALTASGLLSQEGAVMNETVAIALARTGEALFAEDVLTGNGIDSKNPWAEEHENLSEQGQIIRNDPAKAQALVRAAGLEPRDFGLS